MFSRIWDTATGQCLQTLVHEDNAPVVSVCFSPNGKYVLAWTLDGSVRLWDYVSGLCKKTYQGHENKKYSLGGAFGVYGKDAFVVSGSEDGSIIFWDVKSKKILQRLDAHNGVVLWVDTHPSLPIIASGGLDAKVQVWVNEDEDETMDGMLGERTFYGNEKDLPEQKMNYEGKNAVTDEIMVDESEEAFLPDQVVSGEKNTSSGKFMADHEEEIPPQENVVTKDEEEDVPDQIMVDYEVENLPQEQTVTGGDRSVLGEVVAEHDEESPSVEQGFIDEETKVVKEGVALAQKHYILNEGEHMVDDPVINQTAETLAYQHVDSTEEKNISQITTVDHEEEVDGHEQVVYLKEQNVLEDAVGGEDLAVADEQIAEDPVSYQPTNNAEEEAVPDELPIHKEDSIIPGRRAYYKYGRDVTFDLEGWQTPKAPTPSPLSDYAGEF